MRRFLSLFLSIGLTSFLAGCSGLNPAGAGWGGSNSGGGSGGSGGSGAGGVSVSPASPTVRVFGTQAFQASVSGLTNSNVIWQVNGVAGGSLATGFISSSGVYSAPSGVPTKPDGSGGVILAKVKVTAVSQANSQFSGSAVVTIESQNDTAQASPVKLGTSGGNVNDVSGPYCCAGTLGSLITASGSQFILSNNHVLGKSDFASLGDPISQPGLIETNCQLAGTQTVAHLTQFYNLQAGAPPKIDAAIAQVVSGMVDPGGNILLLGATQSSGVPDPGAPHGGSGVAAQVSQAVAKSGRTTGLTCSSVLAVSVAANVNYYRNCGDTTPAFTVAYTDLVSVAGGSFSAEGDSGSLIVTQSTTDPVALLFGGSDTDTVGNPVSDVLAAFPGTGNTLPTFVGGAAHAVIGCTLPTKPASAAAVQSVATADSLHQARLAGEASAPEILGKPVVQAIGVGASYDRPGAPAVLLFVKSGGAACSTGSLCARSRADGTGKAGSCYTHAGIAEDAGRARRGDQLQHRFSRRSRHPYLRSPRHEYRSAPCCD